MKTVAPAPVLASLAFLLSTAAFAAPPTGQDVAKVTPDMIQTASDIPTDWKQPQGSFDYVKRDVMIPMRDGVKLYTVIVIPKGAHDAPIVLTRTPYNASGSRPTTARTCADAVLVGRRGLFVDGGYIRVYQDIRGKYGSEGDYVMTRPPIGPLNPTTIDRHHRRLGHHRLAGEERPAGIERQASA